MTHPADPPPDRAPPASLAFELGSSVFYLLRPGDETYEPVWVSRNIRRIFGFEPAEVLQPDWWPSRLHPEDREAAMGAVMNVLELGAVEHEYRLRDADGEHRWIRDELRAIPSDGGPPEILGSWTDLTLERRREEIRRERFLEAILERAHHVITVLDGEGTILYESPSLEVVLGWKPEELEGKPAFDFVHPDDVAPTAEAFRRLVEQPEYSELIEFRFRHRDGGWRVLRGRGNNLLDDPLVSGIVFNGWDVTEEKQLEAELKQAQKVELLGQLAGSVAHDFNNILAAIQLNAELVRTGVEDEALATDLADLLDAARRGRELTRRLLSFGRRKEGEVVELDLTQAVDSLQPLLERLVPAPIRLELELVETPLPVRADPTDVEQIAMNLVVNARDAMKGGEGVIRVTTRERVIHDARGAEPAVLHPRPGRFAVLAVEDEGPGIPEEIRERIFDPFYTTKPEGEGTGLGLATVYRAVDRLGGFIELDTEEGSGTRFAIHVPLVGGEAAG